MRISLCKQIVNASNIYFFEKTKSKFKDTIFHLQRFVEKWQFFNQNNQWLNNIMYHEKPIYCSFEWHNLFFSTILRFSLLVLKIRFEVYPFTSENVHRFSISREIFHVVVISANSSTKPCLSFWNFNFQPRYLVKRSLFPWNQLYFLYAMTKTVYHLNRTI